MSYFLPQIGMSGYAENPNPLSLSMSLGHPGAHPLALSPLGPFSASLPHEQALNLNNSFQAQAALASNPYLQGGRLPGRDPLTSLNPLSPVMSPVSPVMMARNDLLADPLSSMSLNYGPSPRAFPPGLSNPYDMAMPLAVGNYFDKQSQIMNRILKDVEEYTKLEYMKRRAALDQQFLRNDPMPLPPLSPMMLGGFQQPQSQPRPQYQPLQDKPYLQDTSDYYEPPKKPVSNPSPSKDRRPSIESYIDVPTPKADSPMKKSLDKTPPMKPLKRVPTPEKKEPEVVQILPKNKDPEAKVLPKPKERMQSITKDPEDAKVSKKKPAKKGNRARARQMLRQMGWAMTLPGVWWMSAANWAENRLKRELKVLEEKIPESLEKFIEFAASAIQKEVTQFVTDKNSMVIVSPGKTSVKSADMSKRCLTITEHLVKILDSLSLQLGSGKLPKTFFKFLADLTEDDAVIPENLLSGFEIDRLTFNVFGNLKGMNEWKSKMILSSFVLIKGLLCFILMRPWTTIPSIKEKDVNLKNMINAGSVLYQVTMDLFRENLPVAHHDVDPPFKGTVPGYSALDPENKKKIDVIPEDNENDEQEILAGFYKRDLLLPYIKDKPQLLNELKEAVSDFLDELYGLSHNTYQKKQHVKELFGEHRPKKN